MPRIVGYVALVLQLSSSAIAQVPPTTCESLWARGILDAPCRCAEAGCLAKMPTAPAATPRTEPPAAAMPPQLRTFTPEELAVGRMGGNRMRTVPEAM